jgi:DNA-directed RNA polymerase specialized sigma24 family protein
MTPVDPQAVKRSPDEAGARRQSTKQEPWVLTPEAFDKLLANFSANRDEAGIQYERIRTKLVRYFESRHVGSEDARADDTLNRVARRLDQGQQIENLTAYIYRTAYLVFLEALKEPGHAEIDLEKAPTVNPEAQFLDTEPERRQHCFDQCLSRLTVENRELILGYYREEGRAKIDFRKQLADGLRIPLNALRIRAHRIRVHLERCIAECLGQLA